MRGKDNLLTEVQERLEIAVQELPLCFREVRDELVIFRNDKHRNKVRLIEFKVAGSYFRILTNRFDLSTLKIIILYAYRWQIELFFKYLKRTLKGLHLFNHSENGVEIQFYLLMTLALLLLKMKQDCQKLNIQKPKAKEKSEKKEEHPSEWIRNISKIFYESWKISRRWLQIVKNSLSKVIDNKLLTVLNSC